jgi:FkbM family methyltransferase
MYFFKSLLRRVLPKPLALAIHKRHIVHRMLNGPGTDECDIYALPQFISRGDTVFDIGANNGAYTIAMSKLVGPSGRVYAFEPIPHNLDILRTVVTRLQFRNVTILPIAVSDSSCRLPMTVPTVGFGGGYSLARFSRPDDSSDCEVECDTIDSLIGRGVIAVPTFIKCDVEGAEKQVVAGAAKLIADHHPPWLLETYQSDMFGIMHALGYRSFVYEVHRTMEPVEQRLTHARNYYFLTK